MIALQQIQLQENPMSLALRLALLCALALMLSHGVAPSAAQNALGADISTRAAAQALFNTQYRGPGASASIEWSGQPYPACAAGTTSATFRAATLQRINYFRSMAGLAPVRLSDGYNQKAQAAALMVQADPTTIDHSMPPGWPCHSTAGQEAGLKSNLAQGHNGPDAIDAYMEDYGAGNTQAGHRRWILYPQTQQMGTGDTAAGSRGSSFFATNVLWVMDDRINDPAPAVRDGFVAWPPKGFVPYQVVFPRWSFSIADANFSAATVSVTSGGQAVTVQLEAYAEGFGDNTLVWRMAGLSVNGSANWPRPAADTVYSVTISNVRVGGQTRSYTYDVTIFDQDRSIFTPTNWVYLPLTRG
jgi:uncharacterized protein YkwD